MMLSTLYVDPVLQNAYNAMEAVMMSVYLVKILSFFTNQLVFYNVQMDSTLVLSFKNAKNVHQIAFHVVKQQK